MTIDLNRLKTMNKDELVSIAQQLNAPFNAKNSNELLVESIINTVMQQTLNKPKEDVSTSPKVKEAVFLTQMQLENALAPIKERCKAFSTKYDLEARCVIMQYSDGRYRHLETMSLSCPLTKFMRKAAEIAKGPLIVRSLKQEEWGGLGGNKGNNQYAQTVLAG